MPNLTGFWAGQFHYANAAAPPVSFDCELVQTAAYISGCTTERNELMTSSYFIISAIIEGKVSKSEVSFTKIYQTEAPEYVPVKYNGKVNQRSTEIKGKWDRPDWNGTFIMRKDSGQIQQKREMAIANDIKAL